ncbi:MAG TPA: pyridoxal-dependent decarboxylase [Blastocatellia bacterium]|nr:pyridoxal-dependent decarboxylase [Blastocatellia bacterium]
MDSDFRKPLESATSIALSYLEGLNDQRVAPTADLATLRSRLGEPLAGEGKPADQVIADLLREIDGGVMGSAGGRFFGWVVGGALPAALAADWLTSTWDQNAGLYAAGPAAAVVEEIVGKWLKDILGLPPVASFALVTGCQMAHMTCLAAARHRLLANCRWDVEQRGLFGAPPIRILSSTERHGTFERAIRYLGLGLSHIIYLPTDDAGRLEPSALQTALERDPSSPTLILLQAGDVNIGAYDRFSELVPVAKSYGAWVHVDGAFGLWAAASSDYRHLVDGVSGADSWATDGHKWLNVPYDCGYAFVADPEAHRAAMSYSASYLARDDSAREEMDWTPEWSRRARGFSTYAALRQLGRRGISDLVERCCRHARNLFIRIGGLPGAEVLWEPIINQGLVRFLDPEPGAVERDHNEWTDRVIAAIVGDGEAYFSGTTWRGRRAMRVSVSNWQTSDEDVERTVASVARVLNAMGAR